MALRIGIDVDGVLADFRTAFHATSREALGRQVPEVFDPVATPALAQQDVRRVWETVGRTHNWWTRLPPYEPARIARLYELTRASGWEVFFLTNRPPSAGDSVQYQTQWWIEQHGFYLPAVLTVPGSRGEVANGLRLNLIVDDLLLNCIEVVGASTAKALLMLRSHDKAIEKHALDRGIGVVSTLEEALEVIARLETLLPGRSGRLMRLAEWFSPPRPGESLPYSPRETRPLPPLGDSER